MDEMIERFRQRGRTLAPDKSLQGDQWMSALGRVGSVGAYDHVVRRLSLDVVYGLLLEQLACEPACRVLDLGCGTGALGSLLRCSYPEARIAGVDRDPRIIVRAANRWAHGEASAVLGLAQRLPFSDNAFDIVIATLFLHHLTHAQKLQALCEGRRVLRPGGWLHVADWTRPRRGIPAMGFALVRLLDGYERTADNAAGRLGDIIRETGFDSVEKLHHYCTHGSERSVSIERSRTSDRLLKDQNLLR